MSISDFRRIARGLAASVLPAGAGYVVMYLGGLCAHDGEGLMLSMLIPVGPMLGVVLLLAFARRTSAKLRTLASVASVLLQYFVIFGVLPWPIAFYRSGLTSSVQRTLPMAELRAWAYQQAADATNSYFIISAENTPAFLKRGPLAARHGVRCFVREDNNVTNVTLMWKGIGVTVGPTERTSEDRTMVAEDMQVFVVLRQ